MSTEACLLCTKNNNLDFIARCNHKFHSKCAENQRHKYIQTFECPQCKTSILWSKIFEKVVKKAQEQESLYCEDLDDFFIEILKYKVENIIPIEKSLLEIAVSFGFDLNFLDGGYEYLIKYICANDLTHKLNILLELGLRLDINEPVGNCFLYSALRFEAFGILEKLKEFGFDPKSVNKFYPNQFRLSKWLIENGFDFNKQIKNLNLIHVASDEGNFELIKLLVEMGVDINLKDRDGLSPLHILIDRTNDSNNLFLIENLLDMGADIESLDKKNSTPLYKAIKTKKQYLVKVLISRGADYKSPIIKKLGLTLIWFMNLYENDIKISHIQSTFQNISISELLNERDSKGQTCLHKVMRSKYMGKHVSLLIKLGADVNCQDYEGNTPAHCLGIQNYYSSGKLKLLIDHGADLEMKNNEGEMAFYKLITYIKLN